MKNMSQYYLNPHFLQKIMISQSQMKIYTDYAILLYVISNKM